MRVEIEFVGFFNYQERWGKYEEMFKELLAYQNRRICLLLNGRQSTPYEIVHACMTAEEGGENVLRQL